MFQLTFCFNFYSQPDRLFMPKKIAVIIGAGPAGLTAAYEFLDKTDIQPIVFEASGDLGGIAKTVNYKGNRIDIGGHRFFSKSDRIVRWWLNILPLQGALSKDDIKLQRAIPLSKEPSAPDPEKTDRAMLYRQRISRIAAFRKFFEYPISLSVKTLTNMGIVRVVRIFLSYVKTKIFPIKSEKNLEDFFINRFGKELYLTFFKSYTEKVWGVPCQKISPEWGAQRIKGLSITKTITHALKKIFFPKEKSIKQKGTETSLIEQFMYPKLGPGQMWQEVHKIITQKGAEVHMHHEVLGLIQENGQVAAARIRNCQTGQELIVKGDYFFSTMPIKDLLLNLGSEVPVEVQNVARGLCYRDFITVGLLLKKMKIKNDTKIKTVNNIVPDNWIYVQEEDVLLGRVQIFNNWSPYLVKEENTVWIGLEYFCDEGDELWRKPDNVMITFAVAELIKIGFLSSEEDFLDGTVLRMPKAYPSYFGTYGQFNLIKDYVNSIENLFLVGRNGMHRYNNQDHSMMTAIVAVENIIKGVKTKENIWSVNMEKKYHE